jgi:hypothetical protein
MCTSVLTLESHDMLVAWDCLSVLMVLAPHGPVGTPDWLGHLGLKWAARLEFVLTGLNPGPGPEFWSLPEFWSWAQPLGFCRSVPRF